MPGHGVPEPWSEHEIEALADFVADQEAVVGDGGAWRRDGRADDRYEGNHSDSAEVFVVNLGDRPGFLDQDDELIDRFTLDDPDG